MSYRNAHGLTPQQEKFAQEVAKGKTLADAYRVAYPNSKDAKSKSVHEMASTVAAKIKVSSRIEMLREKAEAAAVVTRERLLREIGRLAFADPRRLLREDGTMLPLHELDDDTAAAIASVEVDEYGKLKYKLWDKGAAQEKLAKHLGVYEKDNRQQSLSTVEALTAIFQAAGGTIVKPRPDAATYAQDDDDDD